MFNYELLCFSTFINQRVNATLYHSLNSIVKNDNVALQRLEYHGFTFILIEVVEEYVQHTRHRIDFLLIEVAIQEVHNYLHRKFTTHEETPPTASHTWFSKCFI
jgi:hypothetical protein